VSGSVHSMSWGSALAPMAFGFMGIEASFGG
jgi:hypothetical protein